jgi:demethylmenaquinone methyltransferase/2-methoxy-6-polyprenyl-1,4-benzoquinol methylase
VTLRRRIRERIGEPDAKRDFVRDLFGRVAGRYDLTNDVMSLGLHRRWKRQAIAIADPGDGDAVLDLAGGTGDLALAAAERGAEPVVVADLTPEMMRVGRTRAGAGGLRWVAADALALPFPERRFDRVLVGYGLRNFPDLDRSLSEILRCLRPGGRLVALDFGKPRSGLLRRAYLAYLDVSTRAIGWALHRDAEAYLYIPESLRRFPAQRGVSERMRRLGFVRCGYVELLLGTMAINFGERPEA